MQMIAAGLMSGTSLDGIDAALLATDGDKDVRVLAHASHQFAQHEQDIHRQAVQAALNGDINSEVIAECGRIQALLSAPLVQQLAAMSGKPIDVVGFHGQTLLHEPEQAFTLQVGDATLLSQLVNSQVVHDFRSADMNAGGQGAPLVPIYHQALLSKQEGPQLVVNIGGVANLSLVDGERLVGFDTGPGNGLMDQLMMHHGRGAFDKDGAVAASGQVRMDIVTSFLDHAYFDLPPPKSLDRYDFDLGLIRGLSLEDAMATLCAMTAYAVADGLRHLDVQPNACIIAGGGRHNPTLMGMIRDLMPCRVEAADELGWSVDGLEAEAFAYLAVRFLRKLPATFPATTGCVYPVVAGELVG